MRRRSEFLKATILCLWVAVLVFGYTTTVLSAPIAQFTVTPGEAAPDTMVFFNATSSYDDTFPNHAIVNYRWDFDVEAAKGPNPDWDLIIMQFNVAAFGSEVQHAYFDFGYFYPVLKVVNDINEVSYAIGEVRVNQSAVPIPATVWLLGSGLLGLIGLRRKFRK